MLTMTRKTEDSTMTPGQWLKAARIDAHLTQEEVARALNIVGATVSAYENGRIRKVDEQYVPTLARLLRKGVVETRRGLGLFVPPDAPEDPPALSVVDAIEADPDLIPEAKAHLIAQFELLLRLTRPTTQDRMQGMLAATDADTDTSHNRRV